MNRLWPSVSPFNQFTIWLTLWPTTSKLNFFTTIFIGCICRKRRYTFQPWIFMTLQWMNGWTSYPVCEMLDHLGVFLAEMGQAILIWDASKLGSEMRIAHGCIQVTKFRPTSRGDFFDETFWVITDSHAFEGHHVESPPPCTLYPFNRC